MVQVDKGLHFNTSSTSQGKGGNETSTEEGRINFHLE